MRIGFFTSIDAWGGSEVYLRSLIAGVRAAGHEALLFGVGGARLFQELEAAGVTCVAWRMPAARGDEPAVAARARWKAALLGGMPPAVKLAAGALREARHLARLFRRHPVDVMHVNVHGYEMAGLACRWTAIPCVGVYRTLPEVEPSCVRRALIRWTAWTYTLLVMPSEAARDAWRMRCGLPAARCRCVWNGVDVERLAARPSAPRRATGAPLRVVCVGRIDAVKGTAVLVDAVRELPPGTVEVLVAGDGPLRSTLEEQARQAGLNDRLRFLGHVEPIEPLLLAADAFVLPSTSEGCPLALLEAMAAGLPVVTTDVGPMPQINVDGVTGLVVPVRDPHALATALRMLAEDPARRAAMGTAARRRAEARYSRQRMIAEMLDVYRGLAARAGPGRGGDEP